MATSEMKDRSVAIGVPLRPRVVPPTKPPRTNWLLKVSSRSLEMVMNRAPPSKRLNPVKGFFNPQHQAIVSVRIQDVVAEEEESRMKDLRIVIRLPLQIAYVTNKSLS